MILDIGPNANSWWMTHIICSPELQPLYNSEISMNIGKRYYTSHGKSMHATFLLRLISSRKNSWTRLNDLKACFIFAWTNKMVRFMIPKLWIMSLTIQFWLRERDPRGPTPASCRLRQSSWAQKTYDPFLNLWLNLWYTNHC